MKNTWAIERRSDNKYLSMYDDDNVGIAWTDNTEDAWLFESVKKANDYILNHIELSGTVSIVSLAHKI